jgi:hypothetical protein
LNERQIAVGSGCSSFQILNSKTLDVDKVIKVNSHYVLAILKIEDNIILGLADGIISIMNL